MEEAVTCCNEIQMQWLGAMRFGVEITTALRISNNAVVISTFSHQASILFIRELIKFHTILIADYLSVAIDITNTTSQPAAGS